MIKTGLKELFYDKLGSSPSEGTTLHCMGLRIDLINKNASLQARFQVISSTSITSRHPPHRNGM